MNETPSQLLPCPNPWCMRSTPRLFSGRDRRHLTLAVHVGCEGCRHCGPVHGSREAAIAAWNTRTEPEAEREENGAWRDAAHPAPEGQPVMALYRAFNRPDGRWMKHVVWWCDGGWRIYPFTANKGYVDRWRPLATN